MADAVLLFPPGFQVKNASGTIQNGAVLRFFDAGTSDTRTIYSNPTLVTSLGTTVTTNSAGRPASGGNEVLVYASEGNLKVTAETSAAVSLWSYDNVIGALDTVSFNATTAIPETPVLTKTGDYIILAADQGSVVNFNVTSDTTATLPSAVTMGDGWRITIRNTHETSIVTITPVGGQTVNELSSYVLYNKQDGVTVVSDGANWHIADSAQPVIGHQYAGHLFGLGLSNNGTDATNDIDIAVGSCASSDTVPALMVLSSAITKRLDAAWAVGTGNGGLDTGSIANTTYHIFLIKRSDTGVVDALFSTSATAPTMPSNYDKKRRIGSVIRASAALLPFRQDGDAFQLVTDIAERSDTATVAWGLITLTGIPAGLKVQPLLTASAAASTGGFTMQVGDARDTGQATPIFLLGSGTVSLQQDSNSSGGIFSDTSARIHYIFTETNTVTASTLNTRGWIDSRGRLA